MGFNPGALQQFARGIGEISNILDSATDMMNVMYGGAPSSTEKEGHRHAKAVANLEEQKAKEEAAKEQNEAKRRAETEREKREQLRSHMRVNGAASGTSMSGSALLLNESTRQGDIRAEEDILFKGQQDSQRTLNEGRSVANVRHTGAGLAAKTSTLSLGSSIYGPRR